MVSGAREFRRIEKLPYCSALGTVPVWYRIRCRMRQRYAAVYGGVLVNRTARLRYPDTCSRKPARSGLLVKPAAGDVLEVPTPLPEATLHRSTPSSTTQRMSLKRMTNDNLVLPDRAWRQERIVLNSPLGR